MRSCAGLLPRASESAEQSLPTGTADLQPYRDVLDDVYTEVWELRGGEPVVLRATTTYGPAVSAYREAGVESECTAAGEEMNRVVREAAEAHGATFVSTHDLFNGPGHHEDPGDKGYIAPDGIHPSEEGKAAIAATLEAAGFDLTAAP